MNTQGIQKTTHMIGGVLAKNSPTILTWLSVSGLVGTLILGVKATPKALLLIDDRREELAEEDESFIYGDREKCPTPKMEIIKATWKCYIPAAAMGAVTIGCIIGANSINLRRNAALAGLYSISEKAIKEYQSKVVEHIGKNKEREIRDEVVKDKLKKNPVKSNEVILTGRGDELCYDAMSGRYFKSDMETITNALNKVSRRLMSDMFISLNEVYSELDIEGTKLGDLVGWHVDNGLIEPDFRTQLAEDGRPCLVLDFEVEPKYLDRN